MDNMDDLILVDQPDRPLGSFALGDYISNFNWLNRATWTATWTAPVDIPSVDSTAAEPMAKPIATDLPLMTWSFGGYLTAMNWHNRPMEIGGVRSASHVESPSVPPTPDQTMGSFQWD